MPCVIGHRHVLDGHTRPLMEDDGRQWVIGPDGEPVYGNRGPGRADRGAGEGVRGRKVVKQSQKWAILVVVGVLVLGWLGNLGYRMATATTTTTYRIVFATMPANDESLAGWLRSQPGVLRADVSRDGTTLIAAFDMPTSGKYPEPPVVREAGQFGYAGWKSTDGGVVLNPVPLFPWK